MIGINQMDGHGDGGIQQMDGIKVGGLLIGPPGLHPGLHLQHGFQSHGHLHIILGVLIGTHQHHHGVPFLNGMTLDIRVGEAYQFG